MKAFYPFFADKNEGLVSAQLVWFNYGFSKDTVALRLRGSETRKFSNKLNELMREKLTVKNHDRKKTTLMLTFRAFS